MNRPQTEPLTAEKARYNEQYGLPAGACNCHHGSARFCPIDTQANFDSAAPQSTLSELRRQVEGLPVDRPTGTIRPVRSQFGGRNATSFEPDGDYLIRRSAVLALIDSALGEDKS